MSTFQKTVIATAALLSSSLTALSQQSNIPQVMGSVSRLTQTQAAPVTAITAKYVENMASDYRVAPSYRVTPGTGLNVNISAGSSFCSGSVVNHTAGIISLTANSKNYIYLNAASACIPSVKTTAFVPKDIPVAVVTTTTVAVSSISDARTVFSASSATPGQNQQILTSDGNGGIVATPDTIDPTSGSSVLSGLTQTRSHYQLGDESVCGDQSAEYATGPVCDKALNIFRAGGNTLDTYRSENNHTVFAGFGQYKGNVSDTGVAGAAGGADGIQQHHDILEKFSPAINNTHLTETYDWAFGDGVDWYSYYHHHSGFLYGGDEGKKNMGLSMIEDAYYRGTLNSIDSTGTLPNLSGPTTNPGTPYINNPGVMLNITQALPMTCQLTGNQTRFGGPKGFLHNMEVTGCSLPVTTVWGYLPTIPTGQVAENVTVPTGTVTLTLQGGSIGSLPIGTTFCTIASAIGTWEPVAVTTTAAASGGTQMVTMSLHDSYITGTADDINYPPILACGGVSEYYVSSNSNYSMSGERTTYPAIVSVDPTHIAMGRVSSGGWTNSFPDVGAEYWAASGPNSAFTLIPGSKIVGPNVLVSYNSVGYPVYTMIPPVIMAHSLTWATGDVIESPSGMTAQVHNITAIGNVQNTPCHTSAPCSSIAIGLSGKAMSGAFAGISIGNLEPVTDYPASIASGTVNPPPTISPPPLIVTGGIWNSALYMESLPYNTMFGAGNCTAGKDVSRVTFKTLFELPSQSNSSVSHLGYDCATLIMNYDQTFNAATLTSPSAIMSGDFYIGDKTSGIHCIANDCSPSSLGGATLGDRYPWGNVHIAGVETIQSPINLTNGNTPNVSIQINPNTATGIIIPGISGQGHIGTSAAQWYEVQSQNAYVSGQMQRNGKDVCTIDGTGCPAATINPDAAIEITLSTLGKATYTTTGSYQNHPVCGAPLYLDSSHQQQAIAGSMGGVWTGTAGSQWTLTITTSGTPTNAVTLDFTCSVRN